ncbi:F-box-like domain superfamily [Arabidopsis thaliana x Arabidopsis arenosa]|uniref:F-box-like domain superfamily n=1 Tax=Arabidopsis thaliana x Arabidopsis arenosa TaxID=1240361 RepID=A0A8T1XHS1_9BRAS|nr:F-box-like domain superfamily [Arabidopsis thaliana x Arabidopsis arenosa]
MVGRKKKAKICDKLSQEEDRISQLPEPLISEILLHLSTKDAVRTSALSTKWRYIWQSVPGLELDPYVFSNFDAFVSFVERFFDSHKKSWIRKLQLYIGSGHGMCDLNSWIDAVTTRRIQHLDLHYFRGDEIPLSLYTCETLVHLRLSEVTLSNADFVSLPCLKIMHFMHNRSPNETTLQKLISGSPVLEDLTIIRYPIDNAEVLQVRSHTLKRVYINEGIQVLIDAPLLQCLRVTVSSPKNFQIVNLGSSAKLDIDFPFTFGHATYSSSMIHDILTDISRVRELVISNDIWKEIFQYSKSGPVLQFCDLSRLDAKFSETDLDMLPTILESCPKLESLILELVKDHQPMRGKKKKEPKAMFSTVPQCLVSSLKFVEWKRSISGKGVDDVPSYLMSWFDAAISRKIQHLDAWFPPCSFKMPLRLYTCETLVSLKLFHVTLDGVEVVSLPCLKTMHLKYIWYGKEATFERLVTCCPVLEELKISGCVNDNAKVFRVLSRSLKKLRIKTRKDDQGFGSGFVIDAPRLCFLRINDKLSEGFIINDVDSNAKVDISLSFGLDVIDEASISSRRSSIRSFLHGISKVRDMTLCRDTFKLISQYSKIELLPQFGYISALRVTFRVSDMKCLPTFLGRFSNLKSLILVWNTNSKKMYFKELRKFYHSALPECLLSSLEFVDIKTSISGHAAELKLVLFLLKNSTILKKLTMLKEDRISELPDPLICQILTHLPAKDTVRTSVLSTRWRSLWLWVPSLVLSSRDFSDFNAFASFGDRFFDSDRVSCLDKLELDIIGNEDKSYIISWIDASVKRKVQHLCVRCHIRRCYPEMPVSLYVCGTLVSLNLVFVTLDDVDFVSFPRLKTMHLLCVRLSKDATFERFISCCPVLEDLRISGCVSKPQPFRVHSRSLKRLYIGEVDSVPGVVIDAPQLCCLRIMDNKSKSFIINNLEYGGELEVYVTFGLEVSDEASFLSGRGLIRSFLSGILKVGDLTIYADTFKLFEYYHYEELHSEEMNKIKCLQSSLEFVDFKLFSGHVAEMKLVRCFLEELCYP